MAQYRVFLVSLLPPIYLDKALQSGVLQHNNNPNEYQVQWQSQSPKQQRAIEMINRTVSLKAR